MDCRMEVTLAKSNSATTIDSDSSVVATTSPQGATTLECPQAV